MPFRERLKKTFSRSHSTGNSETSSLSKTDTNGTTLDYRKHSNVYKPGEKMPPMKYRRPVAKEHKDHLESFSFANAWRRKSHQSLYSPMGSRLPSRAPSVVTGPSRNGSVTTVGSPRKSFQRGGSLDVPPDGRLDAVNVGHSPQAANEDTTAGAQSSPPPTSPRKLSSRSVKRLKSPLANGAVTASQENSAIRFSPDDLNSALRKTHLEVPASS